MPLRVMRAETTHRLASLGRASAGALPEETAQRAAGRLCWVAAIAAVIVAAMAVLQFWLQPDAFAATARLSALAFVLPSLFYAAVNRAGWLTVRTLAAIGPFYVVAAAFPLALFEHSPPWPADWPVRGTSLLSLWIVVTGVVLPNGPVRTLLTGLAAASMGPLAYLATRFLTDNPPLPGNRLAVWSIVPFLMAGCAALINWRLYRAEADPGEAREMGSYQLLSLVGRGGMGEVWRARHRMLALNAAVKLIRAEVLQAHTGREAEIMRRRFEREARAIAALRSPHTVALYDYGVAEDGSFYYAMEFLDGLSLEHLVSRFGPQPPARVIHILLQACDSIGEAHQLGLVHRDLKPTNIFVCRLGLNVDFVKVLDFGLVKTILPGETRMTLDGFTAGTPAYMAPEIATGSAGIDGRADLYSLGCVAYWLLTGRLVFEEPSPVAMALAHVQNQLVPPSERTELQIPPCLERAVMACLEKRPEDRPRSAIELAAMLRLCADNTGHWSAADAERWWQLNLPSGAPGSAA
ncbi:MAG: serine/threonine-protein kinase [bacterium]